MKKELHLFIIWKNAMYQKEKILTDLESSFKVRNIFKVKWSEKNWSKNLSRFYGTNLPIGSHKEEHCGKEYFFLIIVEDLKPNYDYRETSRGLEKVNINMFDKKALYRSWTNGGHRIHATNNEFEANHDLSLIFGTNIEDFKKMYKSNANIINYEKDLVGSDMWKNKEELFYVLNNSIRYVVLRDFENKLSEIDNISNCDVDILCENREEMKWLINGNEIYDDNHVQYCTVIKNNNVIFDIKTLGDGYYCDSLENDILYTREINGFFYVPNKDIVYWITLLHSLIHKTNFETEYNSRLEFLYPKIHDSKKRKIYYITMMSKWLKENGYTITAQNDNPFKNNAENIKLFDNECYSSNIFLEISIMKKFAIDKEKLIEENKSIKSEYNRIINSKGWLFLEKLRKIKRRF